MPQADREPSPELPATGRIEPRKPYQKPAFRHEKIFETMALQCGKVQTTEFTCHSNRKNS